MRDSQMENATDIMTPSSGTGVRQWQSEDNVRLCEEGHLGIQLAPVIKLRMERLAHTPGGRLTIQPLRCLLALIRVGQKIS